MSHRSRTPGINPVPEIQKTAKKRTRELQVLRRITEEEVQNREATGAVEESERGLKSLRSWIGNLGSLSLPHYD